MSDRISGSTGATSATSVTSGSSTRSRSLLQTLALIVGAVFILVGILGFIPGITTDYDTMKFAGNDSDAKLLGIFEVSVLHNVVHLLFGLAGIAMARHARTAFTYLVVGGAIYVLLWLYGLFIGDHEHDANFIPVNNADDWLHLVLGAGMIAMGFLGRKADRTRTTQTTTGPGV